MIKHIIILVCLSIVAIFLQTELAAVLNFLLLIYQKVMNGLSLVFSVDAVGSTVEAVLTLLLIPGVIAAVVATIYFVIRKRRYAHTMMVVWVMWAILLAALLAKHGYVTENGLGVHQTLHSVAHEASNATAPQSLYSS